jgi:mRNA interferase MazF
MRQGWKSMTSYKRGDVVLVLFPHSDLQTAKKRPALVVQADNLRTELDQVIVAMITSNLARRGHPSRYFVSPSSEAGRQSGLLIDSVVMTDNLATVFLAAIDSKIGSLPDMQPVNEALRITLGL